jgi:ubiquinone/menaquinone biosynthesis C-methylase UbiE
MSKPDASFAEMNQQLQRIANGFRPAILLLTANHLNLFTELSGKSESAEQIARKLHLDPRATGVFLNALTALGFLKKKHGVYSNSEISDNLLVANKPGYQGDILKHNLNLWQRWSRIEEVLKTGRPAREPKERRSDDELRSFILGMANLADSIADLLWEKVNLKAPARLLDLGGGPGTYSFAACRRYQELSAMVYDLPEVEPIFREQCASQQLEARVQFHAGDFIIDEIPAGFDVVLLSSIIHSLGEAENQLLFTKIAKIISPGGTIIVKDFYISEDGTQPLHAALFAVNMLVGTQAGTCYTRSTVERWLQNSGFHSTRFLELNEQSGLILAVN